MQNQPNRKMPTKPTNELFFSIPINVKKYHTEEKEKKLEKKFDAR